MTTVVIIGLDELQRKLGADLEKPARAATKAIAAEIQGKIAPYPPATEANQPAGPGSRWYERGFGSRWMRADGSMGGRKTSETLGRRWGIEGRGRIGAVLGNIASYAPFVHERLRQAGFHGKRGWKTDEEAIDEVQRAGTIGKIMEAAMMHALGQK